MDRNSDSFMRIHEVQKSSDGFKWGGWSAFNIAAFFVPLAWFYYRKLYLEGTVVFLSMVGLALAAPDIMGHINFGIEAALAVSVNHYYVWRSLKKIALIESSPGTLQARDEMIAKKGGVSVVGAVIGSSILLVMLAWVIWGTLLQTQTTQLPRCDSPEARQVVEEIVFDQAKAQNISTDGFSFGAFGSSGEPSQQLRSCRFTLTEPGAETTFPFDIEWADETKTNFLATVRFNK